MTTSSKIDESTLYCSFKGTLVTQKGSKKSHADIDYEIIPDGLKVIANKQVDKLILQEIGRRRPLKVKGL